MSINNPVLEVYKGIKIRKSNIFQYRMDAILYKTLILESERTGLPISKILAFSSKPCERCSQIDIIVYDKNDDEVRIKKGILYNNMPEGNGTSIIKQHNAKKH